MSLENLKQDIITHQLSKEQLEGIRDWIIYEIHNKALDLDIRDIDSHVHYGKMYDFIKDIFANAIIGKYDYPKCTERPVKPPRLLTAIIEPSRENNL